MSMGALEPLRAFHFVLNAKAPPGRGFFLEYVGESYLALVGIRFNINAQLAHNSQVSELSAVCS